MNGYKTYASAVLMGLIGVAFLFAGGTATWADPSGDYAGIVQRIVGWVMITNAAALASIRHAIAKL